MQNEKLWFNQQLFFYKDRTYHPNENHTLEISVSSNTSDYKIFSPCSILVGICNDNIRKNYVFSYNDIYELVLSFENIIKNISSDGISDGLEILKQNNPNKIFKAVFKKIGNNNFDYIVSCCILSNETDFTFTYVDKNSFAALVSLLKSFLSNYVNLTFSFPLRAVMGEVLNETNNIKKFLKILPSYIVPSENEVNNPPIKNTEPKRDFLTEMIQKSDNKIENSTVFDFEKIMGDSEIKNEVEKEMNVVLKEIDKEKKNTSISYGSIFVDKFLENDISNLKKIISSCSMSHDPLTEFLNRMKESYNDEELFKLDISDNDKKSIEYLSNLFIEKIRTDYYVLNKPIPPGIQMIKFDTKNNPISSNKLNLSYDLLTVLSYLKMFVSKMEVRQSDPEVSNSILYLQYRCLTDAINFSYLEKIESEQIVTCILSRFDSFSENGFFDSMNNELISYKCSKVSKKDISEFLAAMLSKFRYPNGLFVDQLHKKLFSNKNASLPYDNDFTVEQIINEVIPTEIFKYRVNKNLTKNDIENSVFTKDGSPVSKQCLLLFTSGGKTLKEFKNEMKTSETETPLQRYIHSKEKDIPQNINNCKDQLISILTDKNKDIDDILSLGFSIDDIPDNILKAFYFYQLNNGKIDSYTNYVKNIDESILKKNEIISILKNKNKVDVSTDLESSFSDLLLQ